MIYIKISKRFWSYARSGWAVFIWQASTINIARENQEVLSQEEIGQLMGGN